MAKTKAIVTWAIFTVIFGLTPIAVNWPYLRTNAHGRIVEWEQLLGKGELFLIAALLATDLIGRLLNGFPSKQWVRLFAIIAGAVSVGIVIWASVQFAYLVPSLITEAGKATLSGPSQAAFDVGIVLHDSLWAFVLATGNGFGVILIVED
jgi:hypothetical protein